MMPLRPTGVMPNYAGHRPGARAVEATSAYGKWKMREGDDGRAIGGKPSSWMYNDTSDVCCVPDRPDLILRLILCLRAMPLMPHASPHAPQLSP